MRTRAPHTIEARILKFLQHVHQDIVVNDDNRPRVLYTAMTYRLGWSIMSAAQRAGILSRKGWDWSWHGRAPSKRLASHLREAQLEMQREHARNYAAHLKRTRS